jgi:hypothetical protein
MLEDASGAATDLTTWQAQVLQELRLTPVEAPWLRDDDLLEFLHHAGARYRAIVFVGGLDALVSRALPLVPDRAVLIPDAPESEPLDAPERRAAFHVPRAIGFRDAAERDRVHAAFHDDQVPYEIVGDLEPDALERLLAMALHG